jgi:protein-glutamine gamma-glutamyltransferase
VSRELRRRLLAFAALAVFVALSWAGMVAHPPLLRTALATAVIVLALAAALLASAPRRRGPVRVGAVIAAALLGAAAGLLIVGLPARFLLPSGWSELRDGADVGFAGLGAGPDYPYDGPNEWSRLITVLAAPLIVALAGVLSFARPDAERRSGLAGLVLLVTAYATAVTTYGPGLTVPRGLLLLLFVAAWLWLPGLRTRALLPATALIALAAVVAVPLTARLEARDSLVDYTRWTWTAAGGTSFDWDHSYGPIEWERSEDVVLSIRSGEPNYWKASVLDRFDGRTWTRSGLVRAPLELPAEVEPGVSHAVDDEWYTRVSVTVHELESGFVVGPGTARAVISGIDADGSADGATLRAREPPMRAGDVYQLRAYTPDPSAVQMRDVGWELPATLLPFTEVELPRTPAGPTTEVATLGTRAGDGTAPQSRIASSAYGRVAELTERLTAESASAYDAVKAIETHLRDGYRYSETPPERPLPLNAFLFEDRIGYCQQFSGAMALMLRIAGVPTRVVSGFSAGIADRSEGTFEVRALDAHSWVEVYFTGIGWVPFDPTPPAAPAETRAGGPGVASAGSSGLDGLLRGGLGALEAAGLEAGGAPERSGGGRPSPAGAGAAEGGAGTVVLLALAGLLGLAAALVLVPAGLRARGERRAGPLAANEARVAELGAALGLLGRGPRPATTLLELEAQLRSRGEPLTARYLEKLRLGRYAPPGGARPPSRRERSALRRRLTVGRGLRARLAGYRLIPPLAPRR